MPKVSAYSSLTGAQIDDADEIPIVDRSDTSMAGSGTTKQTTIADLRTAVLAALRALADGNGTFLNTATAGQAKLDLVAATNAVATYSDEDFINIIQSGVANKGKFKEIISPSKIARGAAGDRYKIDEDFSKFDTALTTADANTRMGNGSKCAYVLHGTGAQITQTELADSKDGCAYFEAGTSTTGYAMLHMARVGAGFDVTKEYWMEVVAKLHSAIPDGTTTYLSRIGWLNQALASDAISNGLFFTLAQAALDPSEASINTSTLTGSGVVTVDSTADFASSGTIYIATGGTTATVTYTGKTATTFTGCTTTSGGGVMSSGGWVGSNWIAVAMQSGGTTTRTDTATKPAAGFRVFSIHFDGPNSTATFYIGGTAVATITTAGSFPASSPAVRPLAYVIKSAGATSCGLKVDHAQLRQPAFSTFTSVVP